jgi:ribosomal protein S18 acetylase RimI-like enzyme
MTATLSRGRQRTRTIYAVERLKDPEVIRQLLWLERAYAAYALAQLDPGLFRLSEWYAASGPDGAGLVLHSRGGLGRALFVLGHPTAVEAALSLHPGPRFSFGSLRPEHRQSIEKFFVCTRPQTMLRMSVTRARFKPVDGEAVRLTGRDISAINRLYATESGSSAYHARHIEEGTYCGVSVNNLLVSIAGTHVVSEGEGVAVVGNVFTHPMYRGQGLATIATSAVTAELIGCCPLVVLTVESENRPAVAIYHRLGYETQCTLHETPIIRREPVGALSLYRRVAAGWRGRSEGKELVIR